MKIVSIHQPNYLPWLPYLNKIKEADIFVILDIAQYKKNEFMNRNRIRTSKGWTYLTIPLKSKDYYLKPIYKVQLPPDDKWMEKHWKSIEASYSSAEYFNLYKIFFKKLFTSNFKTLGEINLKIIYYLIDILNIETEVVLSSDLDMDESAKSTDLLINIIQESKGTSYLSGPCGKNYLELDKFKKNNIEVRFQDYKHPKYKQNFPGFEPFMSAIDALFNIGKKTKELI